MQHERYHITRHNASGFYRERSAAYNAASSIFLWLVVVACVVVIITKG